MRRNIKQIRWVFRVCAASIIHCRYLRQNRCIYSLKMWFNEYIWLPNEPWSKRSPNNAPGCACQNTKMKEEQSQIPFLLIEFGRLLCGAVAVAGVLTCVREQHCAWMPNGAPFMQNARRRIDNRLQAWPANVCVRCFLSRCQRQLSVENKNTATHRDWPPHGNHSRNVPAFVIDWLIAHSVILMDRWHGIDV